MPPGEIALARGVGPEGGVAAYGQPRPLQRRAVCLWQLAPRCGVAGVGKADKTKASYRDGVLRIELPKADGSRARRIAVKTA
jgi:hypothetical protein